MFRRDYLMNMIEQMTEAVGQILQLKKELKHQDALLVIDELLDKRFGISGNLIRSLSDKDLMAVLTTNGVIETDKLQAIAVTLKQESELHAELGNEDASFVSGLKALQLFMRLSLVGAEPTIANPSKEAEQLLEQLKAYELPPHAKQLQAEWLEDEGQFARAEDVLYELLEDEAVTNEEVEAFYRRLLFFEDDRLEAGGLPREEVQYGLDSLISK
ncbi:hypothetical protein SAMN05216378_5839 [Paenibacillus catalpae]|uniref:Uncharacterized protein n=1 Tax=Paenibacillus catalpae TaxID=1045775 RepID=A0A1I2HM77_9BACL|nr:DUF6483 family protein [Paenibacillus catalpae]SFF29491.1 hypothetical protein SAMN05216378_5839 [Paenibacillus catalpae]